jgi:hypothetical protein
VLLYLRWLAVRNVPPTEPGNVALNRTVWLMATVGVALSFALLTMPGVNRFQPSTVIRAGTINFRPLNGCALR